MTGTLLIYANCQADEMHSIVERTETVPSLFGLERIFLGALHEFVGRHGRAEAEARLRRVTVVWEQGSQASAEERALIRTVVPAGARWLRFPALTCSALWPFGTSDSRPGGDALYPYSDMLAARIWRDLGGAANGLDAIDDDALFDRYMTLSTARMPDLERVLERDLLQWQGRDADADIAMAAFLSGRLRQCRLFYTAGRGSWASTGEILRRLVEATIDTPGDRTRASAEVARMDADYVGNDTLSMPVHPLVAERLGLNWHAPDERQNWRSYRLDFREFIVHCMRLSDLR